MTTYIPSHSRPMVEAENLRVRFGPDGPWVVKGVSFALRRGECLALVGESGSGKSVTSRALVGLAGHGSQVEAARLRIDGEDVTRFSERTWQTLRGAKIGFVMQDALGSLDSLRPVGNEIGEPLFLHSDLKKKARGLKVLELLKAVGVPRPELRARQYPHQLSGGLRQRALFASAIACAPELLIADEPTTALDSTVQAHVLGVLESLRNQNTAMLVISHDLALVARLADRVAVMHDGHIVEQGPIEEILNRPMHPYTKSLLKAHASVHATFQRATRLAATGGATSRTTISSRITDPGAAVVTQGPLLEARHLSKIFAGPDKEAHKVVDDVSFAVHAGQTLGIVGESGSGKTTTARLLLGLETPDAGEVLWRGRDWKTLGSREQCLERKRVQVIFQDPLSSFDPRYTVERVLAEALEIAGYDTRAKRLARSVELLELVRLNHSYLKRRPIELSGGQRQRVAIARALAPGPDVLVCDEAVSALDVSVQAQILELLLGLKESLRLACVFISHDLGVVQRMCDDVLVMKGGRVVEAGAVRDVFNNPRHEYTRKLLQAVPRLDHRERACALAG